MNFFFKVPLQFVDGETDLTVNEGSDVELTCEVTGHPAPRFEWVREDGLALPLSANVNFHYYKIYV